MGRFDYFLTHMKLANFKLIILFTNERTSGNTYHDIDLGLDFYKTGYNPAESGIH